MPTTSHYCHIGGRAERRQPAWWGSSPPPAPAHPTPRPKPPSGRSRCLQLRKRQFDLFLGGRSCGGSSRLWTAKASLNPTLYTFQVCFYTFLQALRKRPGRWKQQEALRASTYNLVKPGRGCQMHEGHHSNYAKTSSVVAIGRKHSGSKRTYSQSSRIRINMCMYM